MYVVDSYGLAVIFCIITMLGWGSWANTLKMTPKKWEFPLYYWDYTIGLVLTTLLFGLNLSSFFPSSVILNFAMPSSALEISSEVL